MAGEGWWTAVGWARHGSQLQTQLYVKPPPGRTRGGGANTGSSDARGARACAGLGRTALGIGLQRAAGRGLPRSPRAHRASGHAQGRSAEGRPGVGRAGDLLLPQAGSGALLAEGKNYPQEMYSAGSRVGENGFLRERGEQGADRESDRLGTGRARPRRRCQAVDGAPRRAASELLAVPDREPARAHALAAEASVSRRGSATSCSSATSSSATPQGRSGRKRSPRPTASSGSRTSRSRSRVTPTCLRSTPARCSSAFLTRGRPRRRAAASVERFSRGRGRRPPRFAPAQASRRGAPVPATGPRERGSSPGTKPGRSRRVELDQLASDGERLACGREPGSRPACRRVARAVRLPCRDGSGRPRWWVCAPTRDRS